MGRIAVLGAVVVAGAALSARGQATQPMVGQFRQGGYPETYNGVFYPGTELRALPGARAQAVVAAAEFRRAQINLDNAIAEIRRAFLRSPELAEALAQEQEAFDELTAAKKRAMAVLEDDTTYLAALEVKQRLAEQMEDARGRKDVTAQERLAMATLKLSYAASVSAMEASALAAEPSVAEARRRLVVAGRRILQMHRDFDEAVRTSPAVLAARQAVQETRVAAVGADALYAEARTVAVVAMNYAYDLYARPQPYIYNAPFYGGYTYTNPVRLGYPIGYPIHYPHTWGSYGGVGR